MIVQQTNVAEAQIQIDCEIEQGETMSIITSGFSPGFDGNPDQNQPYDWSGYVFSGSVRAKKLSTSPVLASFIITVAGNKITLTLDDDATASLDPGTYYFDIKAEINDNVSYPFVGTITIDPNITD